LPEPRVAAQRGGLASADALTIAAWVFGGFLGELLYDVPYRFALDWAPDGFDAKPSWIWAAAGALGALALILRMVAQARAEVPWLRALGVTLATALTCMVAEYLMLQFRISAYLVDPSELGLSMMLGAVIGDGLVGALTGAVALKLASVVQLPGAAEVNVFDGAIIGGLGFAAGVALQWGVTFDHVRIVALPLVVFCVGWLALRSIRSAASARRSVTAPPGA
jgi:hypothetical protein